VQPARPTRRLATPGAAPCAALHRRARERELVASAASIPTVAMSDRSPPALRTLPASDDSNLTSLSVRGPLVNKGQLLGLRGPGRCRLTRWTGAGVEVGRPQRGKGERPWRRRGPAVCSGSVSPTSVHRGLRVEGGRSGSGCAASSSLIWVRGPLLMRRWSGDVMADGVNPALLRGCSLFPGRSPQAATTGR
jgi:hypothetical protein